MHATCCDMCVGMLRSFGRVLSLRSVYAADDQLFVSLIIFSSHLLCLLPFRVESPPQVQFLFRAGSRVGSDRRKNGLRFKDSF